LSYSWKQNEIVIVGAGLAGLFTALKLSPLPVTVVTAAKLGRGASSIWAQAGIAAALEAGDTPEAHARDTIAAGAGIVNERMAHILADEAGARVADLVDFGTPFDRDAAGALVLSREAAHSARRVVRVKGDRAGFAIMQSLMGALRERGNIQVIEELTAKRLEVASGRVQGVHVYSARGAHAFLPARAVVLAAGGIGALYRVTTNPLEANGEVLAMAARAGAIIADAEFVQFHPTAINAGLDPAPLATEALRGEGAILVNRDGRRFMTDIHPAAELAPRDIVARAVFRENVAGRGAFLDCRQAIGQHFAEQFPSVFDKCRTIGIDPVSELIPVAPAVHFHMGGVLTDAFGRTTVGGLWACGEVASTGAHGANRLASNSLLEAVVFGARVADDIRRSSTEPFRTLGTVASDSAASSAETELQAKHQPVVAELRGLMDLEVGIERKAEGLVDAIRTLRRLERSHAGHLTLGNMLLAARFIAVAALQRRESRGSHYRSDHPEAEPAFRRRIKYSLQQIDHLTAAIGE
jgi:L-aspartate oxidase